MGIQRFTDSCTNAAQLYREIHEHGYRGNQQAVRLYIRTLRGGTAAAEPPRPIPTPRKITSWIMRPRDGLSRGTRPARRGAHRLPGYRHRL
jgi:hypothetical protein